MRSLNITVVLKSDGVSAFTELFNGARVTHLLLMIQFSNKGSAIHFLTSLLSLLDEYNISLFNSKIGLFKGITSRAREQFACLGIEWYKFRPYFW